MKIKTALLILVFFGLIVFSGTVFAKKPPWAGEDWNPAHPPAAPEPIAMTLIGMGGSAAVGFYLGRRKRKKDDDNQKNKKY